MIVLTVPVCSAPLHLETSQIPLSTENAETKFVGKLEYRGGLELRSNHEKFGGLSGMAVSADGANLKFVTDNGKWIRAKPGIDANGNLVNLKDAEMGPLIGVNGQPILLVRKRDAESLFRTKDGYVASFEGLHRLLNYKNKNRSFLGAGYPVPAPQPLFDAHYNKGMEAAVALDDGRWVVFAENFPEEGNLLFGWVRQKNRWRPFDCVRTELFQPAGAAVLPDGDIVMLERRFTFLGGFASRLSIISSQDIQPGATLRGREIARLERPLRDENFEGAAAYKNKKGETIIYIVSDDNFFPLQSTLLLKFKLNK